MIVSGFISEYKNKTLDDRISILVISDVFSKKRVAYGIRDNGNRYEVLRQGLGESTVSAYDGLEGIQSALKDGGYDSIYRNATYNANLTTESGLNSLTDLIRIGTDNMDVVMNLVAAITGNLTMEELTAKPTVPYENFGVWS